MLKFSPQNAKTRHLASLVTVAQYLQSKHKIYSFDLPAGVTCPGAKDCKSMAVETPEGWRIQDGPHCKFRCFSASQEIVYPAVRRARQHNLAMLKACRSLKATYALFERSLPANTGIVRLFVAGDFYTMRLLQTIDKLAENKPNILFYCYTKSLHFLSTIECADLSKGIIRPNFLVTASLGGMFDQLIKPLNIRTAKVVFTKTESEGLPIDHDDSHAATIGGSFALLLHGIQPKNTPAAAALTLLRGKGTYARAKCTAACNDVSRIKRLSESNW